MSHLAENLRWLRKNHHITQTELAEAVGLNRPIIGSYEEGRAEPKIEVLRNLADYFKISVDQLVGDVLETADAAEKYSGRGLRILPVAVQESSGIERIPLVPTRAAAGYLNGYGDPEYIGQLPVFDLPFPEIKKDRTYRMFQIKGDSMLPIPSGTYILGSYVEDWSTVRTGEPCIFVTKNDGIVYKRAINEVRKRMVFTLKSDNIEYEPYEVHVHDIMEIWHAQGYFSFDLP
jgi:transcriptional regulator with XRE-family HTH domain